MSSRSLVFGAALSLVLAGQACAQSPLGLMRFANLPKTQIAKPVRPDLSAALAKAQASPADPATLETLGVAYLFNGRQRQAEQTFSKALALTGEDWRLYGLRAAAFRDEGQFTQAESDLNRALSLSPDNPTLLLGRANLSVMMRRWDSAKADLQRVLMLNPKDPVAQKRLAGLPRSEKGQAEANIDRLTYEADALRSDLSISYHRSLADPESATSVQRN